MRHRCWLWSAGMCVFLLQFPTPAVVTASAEQKPAPPNILHIMADMQRWDTVANRSVCRTPHLNRLAREGILFNRSYTATTACCPSRAMLASGAFHWHNGVFNQVHSPPSVRRDMYPNVQTYWQRLRASGYRLAHVGKWHATHERTPFDFGFTNVRFPFGMRADLLRDLPIPQGYKYLPRPGKRTVLRTVQWPGALQPQVLTSVDLGEEKETASAVLADHAIELIQQYTRRDQPWLIEVHFREHDVRNPLKKYAARYDPDAIPVSPSFHDDFENKPGLHRREAESWGDISERDFQVGRAHYYAYFEQQDVQIGRILDALEESGQADRTLVTFCADHGDMCGDHRMWKVGWMPYDGNIKVPLIMRWPGRITPGSVSNHLVQIHDLAHTYTEVSGGEPLPYRDGISLVPLFDDPDRPDWRDHVLQAFYGGEFLYTQRMVITRRYKYVFNGFAYDELYDLQEDPNELHNRVDDPAYKSIVDDMRARLYELMTATEDVYGDNPPPGTGRATPWCAPRYLPRGKRLVAE